MFEGTAHVRSSDAPKLVFIVCYYFTGKIFTWVTIIAPFAQDRSHTSLGVQGDTRISTVKPAVATVTELAARDVYGLPRIEDTHILSAAIREHHEQGIRLRIDNLGHLRDSVIVPNNPIESIDKILTHILNKTDSAEKGVLLSKETDFPIGYARNAEEFGYWIQIASGNIQYIEAYPDGTHYRLTLNGWRRLAELPRRLARPEQAFVAMWFDPTLEEIWEDGIKAALVHTGYKPIRIDRTEHNENERLREFIASNFAIGDVLY